MDETATNGQRPHDARPTKLGLTLYQEGSTVYLRRIAHPNPLWEEKPDRMEIGFLAIFGHSIRAYSAFVEDSALFTTIPEAIKWIQQSATPHVITDGKVHD